ncbi:hypothetical protein OAM67_00425, partial [bacterium]|nr:hypothetical protein [bacterium]
THATHTTHTQATHTSDARDAHDAHDAHVAHDAHDAHDSRNPRIRLTQPARLTKQESGEGWGGSTSHSLQNTLYFAGWEVRGGAGELVDSNRATRRCDV